MSGGGALTATSGIQALGSIGMAYAQSQAIKTQGDYQRQMYELNSSIADLQSKDAINRGNEQVTQHKKATKQLIGAQRASLAAQGIEIDSGSALDLQEDTAQQSALDALTIKNNAFREAWGYKMAATESHYKGEMAYKSSRTDARNTLLAGGLQAAKFGGESYSYARS